MRFLVDMPLSPTLSTWLADQGDDSIHASQVGLALAADSILLTYARQEARIILTADLDYPRLLAIAQADEPGLILIRGGSYSEQEARELVERALSAIPETDFKGSIVVVERGRIRRRRLPLLPQS